MKAALLALAVAMATLQAAAPTGQRGQASNPPPAQTAPLDAAKCKCSIEVTVKRSSSGEALSAVNVTLTFPNANARAPAQIDLPPQQSRGPAAQARAATNTTLTSITGNDGRAVFRDLAEGNYNISAQATGYFGSNNNAFPAQATATVSVGPAVAQTVARGTPRQPVQQITLNLVKGSVVAGQVTDVNRRPANGIEVGAYRVIYQDGIRNLVQTATAVQSDDRGEYRLFWLPPGEYYIRAENTRILAAERGSYPSVTYYPGTLDPRVAVRVTVREGSEISGTNFALQPSAGVTVSGTIVKPVSEGPVGPRGQASGLATSVVLVPRNAYFFENPALIAGAKLANATNNSEAGFEIKNVPPGTYDFYPLYNAGPQPTATGVTRSEYFSGRTPVEVGSENVTGIRSVIQPGANLKVHVTVSGTAPTSGQRGIAQQVTLANIRFQIGLKENAPAVLTNGRRRTFTPDSEGVSILNNLVDGQYFMTGVTGLPSDAYISDIRMDSRSVFDKGVFNVEKNSQSTLDVMVNRGGGTIQGTVQDAKHAPVAGVRLTLIPDAARKQNVLLHQISLSSTTGVFSFIGVAPGHYKLYAWEKNPAGAEEDPEFMREYDLLGTSVNVSLGIPLANIQVPLIPAKR